MAEKNIHPASDAAARVSRFLLGRKRYAGRERIMAVDGSPLNASDLQMLVDFVHSASRQIAAKTKHGSINNIPYNDPMWLADGETMVERYKTEWKEVSPSESER
ncbi:hypothetical protein SEA_WOLLYPOG_53 [Arthrobacter phage Wollypog]|uniref:Uncharacterized protein n=1 Tax=Arthrobacter phage Wollypog TaxID=2790985 RepID=A0A7T3KC87_9CAUD|nr:hypothetical protein PP291_gp53 [Arthrobacter phage Wollypog]QPX62605.1 hypothetical protein SEA_WOLLYPOG_53 [Arthrobacter phage Wollypog]